MTSPLATLLEAAKAYRAATAHPNPLATYREAEYELHDSAVDPALASAVRELHQCLDTIDAELRLRLQENPLNQRLHGVLECVVRIRRALGEARLPLPPEPEEGARG